jgi:hypothetical protein
VLIFARVGEPKAALDRRRVHAMGIQVERLSELAETLISEATSRGAIREGIVAGTGPRPYRRLDCDGRALAYVRERPKKRSVRIDVSGLWVAPSASRLRIEGASGGARLLVRSAEEASEAARYLLDAVEATRAAKRTRAGSE